MVNQKDTLTRLNKEKEYEDKLASDLMIYYMGSLKDISDLSDNEKQKIKKILSKIASDSERHSHMFNMLIQIVLENGENNY